MRGVEEEERHDSQGGVSLLRLFRSRVIAPRDSGLDELEEVCRESVQAFLLELVSDRDRICVDQRSDEQETHKRVNQTHEMDDWMLRMKGWEGKKIPKRRRQETDFEL